MLSPLIRPLLTSLVLAAAPAEAGAPSPPLLAEVAESVGLRFEHRYGGTGKLYFAEIMGAGGALFDYDNDGDLDVYLVQGGPLEPGQPPGEGDRLFRNDLEPGPDGPRLRFTDVTASSGIAGTDYGMAVATGDFDGDGWVDLYVANLGPNRLLRNRGDGTFEEIAQGAGAADPRWSVAASPFDFDGDGDLDLAVGNYVHFTVAGHKQCYNRAGTPDYCGPTAYPPQGNSLLRNRGDGTFEEVTAAAGLGGEAAATLGLVSADFNGDGRLDLYEANDLMPNRLWLNQGDGSFADDALLAGCALSGEGQLEASMGVEAEDLDGDGHVDLFMTHLVNQTNTLYLNDGRAVFRDATSASGLGTPSWPLTGFGVGAVDLDNDGNLDLYVANGAVTIEQSLAAAGDPFPFHQRDQLFRNAGGGRFQEIRDEPGAPFTAPGASRGVAVGDVDNDGDGDLLVTQTEGPARLLLNLRGQDAPWIGLRLVDESGRRDLLGARTGVEVRPGVWRWRRVGTDGSYASARDPRTLFGLGGDGPAPAAVKVRVVWPGGQVEEWEEVKTRAYRLLRRGSGRAITGSSQP